MPSSGLIGKTLGHYRIERMLGEGGMGAVYQATDARLQRPVAVKVMHPHLASHKQFQDRFLQEARAAASLDHPNIVRVHDFDFKDGQLFLVMEWVSGGSLRQYLQRLYQQQQRLEIQEALELTRQVAAALQYAHQQRGMVHRDVKPDNVLLKPANEDNGASLFQVVLTDFGLAKLAESQVQTNLGQPVGTFPYMSPEQVQSGKVDHRSDIYALGIMLYELAVGRLPFTPRTLPEAIQNHTQDPLPDPRTFRPDLPPQIVAVITRSLEKKPRRRFQQAGELVEALLNLQLLLASGQVAAPAAIPAQTGSLATYMMSQPLGGVMPSYAPAPDNSGFDRLVVAGEGAPVRTIQLTQPALDIGRVSEANDLALDNTRVSRKHARLERDANGHYHITDLGSSNGTWLGEKRLSANTPQMWNFGQTVRIGNFWLKLERGAAQGQPPAGAAPAALMADATPPGVPEWKTYLMSSSGVGPMPHFSQLPIPPNQSAFDRIIIVGTGQPSRTVALDRTVYTAGRVPEGNDIVLDDQKVSRQHARIERDPGGRYTIMDLGSTNGTWIGDARLLPNMREAWEYGQTVRIGNFWLKLEQARMDSAVGVGPMVAPVPGVVLSGMAVAPNHQPMSALFGMNPSMGGAGKVAVNLTPSNQVEVQPGGQMVLHVELVNQGEIVDHFAVRVEGIPQEWFTAPVEPMQLLPGDREMAQVSFHPPRKSDSHAGDHAVYLHVESAETLTRVATKSVVLRIAEFTGYGVDLQPKRLIGSRHDAEIEIHNKGNTPVRFNIAGQDLEMALEMNISPTRLNVPPGKKSTVTVHVMPRKRLIFGRDKTYPFDLTIQPALETMTEQKQAGQYVARPVIPRWFLGVVSFMFTACLLLGMLLLAIVVPERNRQAEATATSLTGTAVQIANVQTEQVVTATAQQVVAQTEVAVTQAAQANAAETTQAGGDDDGDGLTNQREAELGTNPTNRDTDGDGLTDGEEANSRGTNPLNRDTDGDNLTDGDEVARNLNPNNPDTDGDGILDGVDTAPAEPPTATPLPSDTTAPTSTLPPTSTSLPTNTPPPTSTAPPTNTPTPTSTPTPTNTLAPCPDFTIFPSLGANLNTTSPNPFTENNITGGGSISVFTCAQIPGGTGFVRTAPDFRLIWSGATASVTISFPASGSPTDSVMLIHTPGGTWLFNDDAIGLSPSITIANPQSGQYDIWIGSYSSNTFIPGTLTIIH